MLPFLSSCFDKDEMVSPHVPGDVVTGVIPMTMYYTNQVYYNLEEEKISGINERSAFDLIFECIDTSTVIRLNTANFAMAANSGTNNFNDVVDTVGLDWKFDGSTGDLDSLAIDNWITINENDTSYSNTVYVINRGINPLGIQLGLLKVKFTGFKDDSFYFTYVNMDNGDLVDAVVTKDDTKSYKQYAFYVSEQEQYEPEIDNWDLLFTQYTSLLYTTEGERYPYLVTGVLQQYNLVTVAQDTTMAFDDIVLSDTLLFDFSSNFDKIGYNWKELLGDINTGDIRYEVRLNYNYIIKNRNSKYFKLRFVNFYDPITGEKGFPTFEYQPL